MDLLKWNVIFYQIVMFINFVKPLEIISKYFHIWFKKRFFFAYNKLKYIFLMKYHESFHTFGSVNQQDFNNLANFSGQLLGIASLCNM